MLMAHPTVLRNLMERYEALSALTGRREVPAATDGGESLDPHVRRQLLDTVYTLCVSTGTREIGPALAAARAHIERHTFKGSAALGENAA
ncbi:DUF5133 domain-containing protein [Actinacidiphila acidipaludis]|uniref:DUF5133 domain-containing protein n=1 Tax=Actinacidiphila acidipaludis TaxID=2873382 RepID=A0ABS7Q6H5_9ACTN|nr:DUF5133 domain-containing protein [Streptomyces acidipaludis]MBY8878752.1 DUF5133 domain-containing protein [Streptomyces acidipaludis]